MSTPVQTTAPGPAPARSSVHIVLVALMGALVALGFWPYYAGLAVGRMPAHPILHVHAAVYTGWMLLLLVQVVLVYRGRSDVHRRLGRFGIGYGALVLLLGMMVTLFAPALHVREGRWTLDEAAEFLLLPIGDMVLFAALFGAAIACRRQPHLHKRLMLLATVVLIYPAVARFAFDAGPAVVLLVWLLPLLLAMGHELVTRRRVERVYGVGLVVLVLAFARLAVMETETWRRIGRSILAPMLSV